MENKDNEIKSNKSYIFDLENNIKEINKQFLEYKQNNNIYNNIKKDELPKLLEQIEELKKQYIYLIEKNRKKLKIKNNIKINYNIINNDEKNIIKDINKNNFNKKNKNISIIPNERYKKGVQLFYINQNNIHSRNNFNELNKINSNEQRKIISKTKVKNVNNISEEILNRKIINNYKYQIMNNYNKIKLRLIT